MNVLIRGCCNCCDACGKCCNDCCDGCINCCASCCECFGKCCSHFCKCFDTVCEFLCRCSPFTACIIFTVGGLATIIALLVSSIFTGTGGQCGKPLFTFFVLHLLIMVINTGFSYYIFKTINKVQNDNSDSNRANVSAKIWDFFWNDVYFAVYIIFFIIQIVILSIGISFGASCSSKLGNYLVITGILIFVALGIGMLIFFYYVAIHLFKEASNNPFCWLIPCFWPCLIMGCLVNPDEVVVNRNNYTNPNNNRNNQQPTVVYYNQSNQPQPQIVYHQSQPIVQSQQQQQPVFYQNTGFQQQQYQQNNNYIAPSVPVQPNNVVIDTTNVDNNEQNEVVIDTEAIKQGVATGLKNVLNWTAKGLNKLNEKYNQEDQQNDQNQEGEGH